MIFVRDMIPVMFPARDQNLENLFEPQRLKGRKEIYGKTKIKETMEQETNPRHAGQRRKAYERQCLFLCYLCWLHHRPFFRALCDNPKEMSPVQKFFHTRLSFSLFPYGLCAFAFKKSLSWAFPPDNGQE
jgi:hypothetical protein